MTTPLYPEDPKPGTILAVGTRTRGGRIELVTTPRPGEPTMRWQSQASSIDGIEKELARIWAQPAAAAAVGAGPDASGDADAPRGRHVSARTSVMNLVVVARHPELGERAGETINRLSGRHPSRTLVVISADPDGPPWLDARVQAYCILPRADAPETCSEQIFLTAGGETGRHLAALVNHCWSTICRSPCGGRVSRSWDRPLRANCWRGAIALWWTARIGAAMALRACASLPKWICALTASRSATSRSSASRAGARRLPRSLICLTSCRI
jgi:hypothetical protein